MRPLCFVLMPFGQKPDQSGRYINFDEIYRTLIRPAVDAAELEPLRADEETLGGFIHKPMFERLMLCEYAVADLTTSNPNVLYELGIRHGIRPKSTVIIFASGVALPFDLSPLRGLRYNLNTHGKLESRDHDKTNLRNRLIECRKAGDDSPVYQLISDLPRPDLARLKSDLFREQVAYSQHVKNELRKARQEGRQRVSEIAKSLGRIEDTEPAILIDVILSYRAVSAFKEMVIFIDSLSEEIKRSLMVQEQYALALNRISHHEDAKRILEEAIHNYGPSSETNGILGRVYKDLWAQALDHRDQIRADAYLQSAIDAYLSGFEADWRDAYPGINALTLMEMTDPVDSRQQELIPVVKYSVMRRITQGIGDYWDYATALELAVLSNDQRTAQNMLSDASIRIRERFEPETTSRNLQLIAQERERKGDEGAWIFHIAETLSQFAPSNK